MTDFAIPKKIVRFDKENFIKEHVPIWAIAVGLGIVLAVSGAFGTSVAPLVERIIYWSLLMSVGFFIAYVMTEYIIDLEKITGSIWLTWLILTLLIGTIMPAVVLGLSLFFHWSGPHFSFLLIPSYTITGLMCAVGVFFNQIPKTTHNLATPQAIAPTIEGASAPRAAFPARPRFFDRLPPNAQSRQIIAVEAQDHYLLVHTNGGQLMILARLSDAVAELDGIEGAQVHRSWWVAKSAVVGAQTGNGRATLSAKVKEDAPPLLVPVSRSFARALRAENWF